MTRMWSKAPLPAGVGRVGLVCVTYQQPAQLRALSGCLLSQTYPDFCAVAIHDGPADGDAPSAWMVEGDNRFRWVATANRENKHGHANRRRGMEFLFKTESVAFIGTTNADNLYAPVYFEAMVREMANGADFVFCNMIHSHRRWQPIQSQVKRKFIDAGNWLVRTELAKQVSWDSEEYAADWDYVSRLSQIAKRPVHVPGYLFMHN